MCSLEDLIMYYSVSIIIRLIKFTIQTAMSYLNNSTVYPLYNVQCILYIMYSVSSI